MKYKCVMAVQPGGPEVLQVVERDRRPPARGEVRIRVLSCSVCRPDLTVRAGTGFYSGTPLGQKYPFVPGYSVIGDVDAVGPGVKAVRVGERVGAMTGVGGYTEYLYWRADRLIPVPRALDPVQAVPIILNYVVAYQVLHRVGKARPGEKALIIGASGGVGTALLQLGKLAGLQMYGLASRSKHAVLCAYGAQPIDYRTQDFAEVLRRAEPGGIDLVLDGMNQAETLRKVLPLLRRGGRVVSFGEPAGFRELFRILGIMLATNLLPNGKSCSLYGTSYYSLGIQKPLLQDWAVLFELLAAGKIQPVIEKTFPILQAAQAQALLESGTVTGNIVLATPDLL